MFWPLPLQFFLHFMCVLFAIVFHVFCVSLGTRTKKSPKKERNITCKNIAHKTHKHRKQTRKKRWCEKFGCACAFLCVLFAFVLRLFIFYYYMFFFLTVVLCFVCFFLRPFAHFVFFLYMQAFWPAACFLPFACLVFLHFLIIISECGFAFVYLYFC